MARPAPLLPVYLAVGEDRLKRDKVLTRIRSRIEELGDIDFNSETFSGESATGDEIVASCNTFPFDSEKRLVVVKDVDKLNKDSQEKIAAYVSDPSDTTVLMLVASKLAANTRLYKAIAAVGPQAVVDCGEKKERDLPETVRSIAASKGIEMDGRTAAAFVKRAGTSTVRIDGELDKLVAFLAGKTKVSIEDVEAVVASSPEVKPWDLADAFSRKDIPAVLALIDALEADGSTPHALLAVLVGRVRDLISARAVDDRGLTGAAAASELGKPDWMVRRHIGWARTFDPVTLRTALVEAAECEARMKTGRDPRITLETWALAALRRS